MIMRIRYEKQGGHYHCRLFTARSANEGDGHLEAFKQVCLRAVDIDQGEELDWHALSIGFFLARGLPTEEAYDLARIARYTYQYWVDTQIEAPATDTHGTFAKCGDLVFDEREWPAVCRLFKSAGVELLGR